MRALGKAERAPAREIRKRRKGKKKREQGAARPLFFFPFQGLRLTAPPLFFFPFLVWALRLPGAWQGQQVRWHGARVTGWLVAYDGSRTPVPLGTPVTRCQARQGHRHAAGHGHGARIARRMNQTRTAYRARFTAELAELEMLIAVVAERVKARRSGTATPASSCGPEHEAGCFVPCSCAPSPPRIGSLD